MSYNDLCNYCGEINMKKLIALTLAVGAFFMTTGCRKESKLVSIQDIGSRNYTAYGRYYKSIKLEDLKEFEGIITNDGQAWRYSADIVSGEAVYDGMPILAGFSDNATPAYIEDDAVIGIVYDRTTAIYDELEKELSAEFDIERNGNEITIKERK